MDHNLDPLNDPFGDPGIFHNTDTLNRTDPEALCGDYCCTLVNSLDPDISDRKTLDRFLDRTPQECCENADHTYFHTDLVCLLVP